ncbi:MAG: hypothetical protein ACRYGK_05870 [Janthinobacterium lividum]
MTTTPNLPPSDDAERQLDDMLAELAAAYERQPVPPSALERLEQRFKRESRQLSEQDLQWLAAAGTLTPQSAEPPARELKDLL